MFYGIWAFLVSADEYFGVVVFIQALIVAHIIDLSFRVIGCPLPWRGLILLGTALSIGTPVAWHIAHVLPDIFISILVLTLFVIGYGWNILSAIERLYVLALATASSSFHLTALPVALSVLLVAVFARSTIVSVKLLPMICPVITAIVCSIAFNFAVWQRVTLTPNPPPMVLARMLADGSARAFLEKRCQSQDFALCSYMDRLATTEDSFTWRLLPSMPTADGKRVKAEANSVVIGTIKEFPTTVLMDSIENAIYQFITIASKSELTPEMWRDFIASRSPLSQSLSKTVEAQRNLPSLHFLNICHLIIFGLSLIAGLVGLVQSFALRLSIPAAFICTVLVALATNATVCGVVDGVFGRYQGRVVWLMPLAAFACWRTVYQVRHNRRIALQTA